MVKMKKYLQRKLIKIDMWDMKSNKTNIWEKLEEGVNMVSKEIVEENRGSIPKDKKIQWWVKK